jgi:hypothetical protein
MSADTEARKQLAALGIKDIKFTGQEGEFLLYEHTDGEPVIDAPTVRVQGDQVTLEAWK